MIEATGKHTFYHSACKETAMLLPAPPMLLGLVFGFVLSELRYGNVMGYDAYGFIAFLIAFNILAHYLILGRAKKMQFCDETGEWVVPLTKSIYR